MMVCLLSRKLWDTRIFYCIQREEIYFTVLIGLFKSSYYLIFPSTSAINTYLHSKQEKNWGNTSFNQLKYYFFLLLFHIKIAYFVRERIHLSIGIFISMKNKFFFFLIRKLRKMVKTSKFVSQRQNKTKKIDVKQ